MGPHIGESFGIDLDAPCQNTACPHYSFQLDLLYRGRAPAIKEQIVDMSLNGSGIRDTARVLKISPTTVITDFSVR
jgi:hypothetical protein